ATEKIKSGSGQGQGVEIEEDRHQKRYREGRAEKIREARDVSGHNQKPNPFAVERGGDHPRQKNIGLVVFFSRKESGDQYPTVHDLKEEEEAIKHEPRRYWKVTVSSLKLHGSQKSCKLFKVGPHSSNAEPF